MASALRRAVAEDTLRLSLRPSTPGPQVPTGMKRKRALELQQAWGDKPCPHPAFAKEYDQGARTGSFICTQCGAVLTFREKGQLMAARRAAEEPPEE
jgi:hypothetical protein